MYIDFFIYHSCNAVIVIIKWQMYYSVEPGKFIKGYWQQNRWKIGDFNFFTYALFCYLHPFYKETKEFEIAVSGASMTGGRGGWSLEQLPPPRFWQKRRCHQAAAARRITTCTPTPTRPPSFRKLMFYMSNFLQKVFSEWKQNMANSFCKNFFFKLK